MSESNQQLPDWEIQVVSPGRVNLLGEHVDYNQGVVLPIAIDRFVRLAARPRPDDRVVIESLDLKSKVQFKLADLEQRIDTEGRPLTGWALYPAGVAWALRESGLKVRGLDAVIASDLPIGAGLSSSAALELAFAAAWQAVSGWQAERMQLAMLCQRAENAYAGVACGLMDQFACAHGVARHALYFDTRDLQWQPLPMPPDTAVVIADSGIRRQLAGSDYNQRRQECEQAVDLLRAFLPDIRSLRDVLPGQLMEYRDKLPMDIFKRARHVVEEIARVQQACFCLVQDDPQGFGELMVAGHASLRDLYEVSLPELDGLVAAATSLEGCYGARLTGAGFGGCTVNLVRKSCTEKFMEELARRYQQDFGRQAQIYLCQPSRGTHLAGA